MSVQPPTDAIDLGAGHLYHRVTDADGRLAGVTEWHRRADGRWCAGYVAFQPQRPGGATWTVENEDPLTISPSVLCDCGAHGFIHDGRWVPA